MTDKAPSALSNDLIHDVLVDCIGLKCPLPVLRARKALQRLPADAVARVESSDPMAILDVPHMVREEGHTVVDQRVDGDRATFWIRRKPPGSV